MKDISNYKPLEQAIMNGEKEVRVINPHFLIACAVAEKSISDPTATNRLIGMALETKSHTRHPRYPEMTYTLLNDQGKPFTMQVNLSHIANALQISKLLNRLYASIKLQKDEKGHLTGVMNINS